MVLAITSFEHVQLALEAPIVNRDVDKLEGGKLFSSSRLDDSLVVLCRAHLLCIVVRARYLRRAIYVRYAIRMNPVSYFAKRKAFLNLKLSSLDVVHFDLEVLNEHVDGIIVVGAEGHDDVSVFHGRLNEVIVGGLDEAVVLGEHVHHSPSTFSNVSRNYIQVVGELPHKSKSLSFLLSMTLQKDVASMIFQWKSE